MIINIKSHIKQSHNNKLNFNKKHVYIITQT